MIQLDRPTELITLVEEGLHDLWDQTIRISRIVLTNEGTLFRFAASLPNPIDFCRLLLSCNIEHTYSDSDLLIQPDGFGEFWDLLMDRNRPAENFDRLIHNCPFNLRQLKRFFGADVEKFRKITKAADGTFWFKLKPSFYATSSVEHISVQLNQRGIVNRIHPISGIHILTPNLFTRAIGRRNSVLGIASKRVFCSQEKLAAALGIQPDEILGYTRDPDHCRIVFLISETLLQKLRVVRSIIKAHGVGCKAMADSLLIEPSSINRFIYLVRSGCSFTK